MCLLVVQGLSQEFDVFAIQDGDNFPIFESAGGIYYILCGTRKNRFAYRGCWTQWITNPTKTDVEVLEYEKE